MSEAQPSGHDRPDAGRPDQTCGQDARTGNPLGVLAALAVELRAEGGLLAETVVDTDAPAEHGAVAGERGAEYALVVEAIREGYLQHYGEGRVVRPDDPDLALLAGDRLYALGLARLAALGDVEAVAVLADVISRSAQAHAEGDTARADEAWRVGSEAVARPASRR
jgi:hypothetical protein